MRALASFPLPSLSLLALAGCVSEHGPLTNRMAQSTTPYLARAARQPVSWQPWGRDAFALAARLDRPILLYVGADDCRWCGVMDREVYGDPGLGALIDSLFVPVRVDRDERPDVAQRYATAVQLLAGLRGYPITVFLTPDGSAFFGGTYFPLDDPITGRGLKQVLPDVARSYRERRGSILRRAALVRERAGGRRAGVRSAPKPGAVQRETEAVRGLTDAAEALDECGAVARARAALDALLRRVYARGRAVRHVGGAGSPERALLGDQVQVAWACLAAREATGETHYLEIAEDLARLLERDFADSGSAGYFDAAATDPTAPALVERAKPVLDDLLPGGNGWAGRVLLRLARLTGDVRYRRRAEATLEAFVGTVGGEGLRAASYLAVVQEVSRDH